MAFINQTILLYYHLVIIKRCMSDKGFLLFRKETFLSLNDKNKQFAWRKNIRIIGLGIFNSSYAKEQKM